MPPQRPGSIARLTEALSRRQGLLRVLRNSGWLMGEQLLRLLVGFFLGVWTARHLGPADFGLLSYALSYTTIFGVVAMLGLNRILVRELVSAQGDAERVAGLMSTAFALRSAAGLVVYGLAVAMAWMGDSPALLLIVLMAAGCIVNASDSVDLYFQSRSESRKAAAARLVAFAVSSGLRIWLLLDKAPVSAFAALALLEFVLIALALQWTYHRQALRLRWRQVRAEHARALLGESAPEILAALGGILFMRLDQVLLQHLVGPAEVGTFAVAARLTELWYFIPVAIVASAFPRIVALRETDPALYLRRIEQLTTVLIALAYAFVLLVGLLVAPGLTWLFGPAYAASAPVLLIQVWCGVFLVLAQTSGAWIMAERRARMNLYRSLLGLAVNLVADLLLIPRQGAVGAAWGALLAFVCAYFLFDFFSASMRPMGWLKLRALLILPAWRRLRAPVAPA